MTAPPPALDHLIMLVPDSSPSALSWLSSRGFSIIQGGTHADGLTCNSLVILSDGTYLEFISFTKDCTEEARRAHWWGSKRPNAWSDWCLSPHPLSLSEQLAGIEEDQKRCYERPNEGGRTKPDGTRIEWRVAFPLLRAPSGSESDEGQRGLMPFWCEDVTDRSLRVPHSDETTTHANGVTGVSQVVLLVQNDESKRDIEQRLQRVLSTGEHELHTSKVNAGGRARVVVKIAETDHERQHVAQSGEGIYQVHFESARGEVVI